MTRLCHHLGVGLLAVMISAGDASGQGGALGDDVITASPPNAQQQAEVNRYVAEHMPRLASDDLRVRQEARNRLLRPLEGQATPSPAFRLEYGRALGGRLTELATSPDVGVALGALRIAGALASEQGYLALARALTDKRPALRVAAAGGVGTMLVAYTDGRHALTPASVSGAIAELEKALGAEPEIIAADAMVVALSAPSQGSDVRPQAMQALFRGMGAQLVRRRSPAQGQELSIVLRAATLARTEVTRPNVPEPLAKDAGVFGGRLLAYSLRQLEALRNGQGDVDPETLRGVAIASEAIVLFSHGRLVEQVQPKLERLFPLAMDGGPIEPVRAAVLEWVGPTGRLTKAPYGARAADFGAPAGAG